jgi:hypothetical protein
MPLRNLRDPSPLRQLFHRPAQPIEIRRRRTTAGYEYYVKALAKWDPMHGFPQSSLQPVPNDGVPVPLPYRESDPADVEGVAARPKYQ